MVDVNTEITDENVDDILENIESDREGAGIVEERPTGAVDPEFDLVWKGETKTLPLSKIRDLAQQGYDYSQKMADYNRNLAQFEADQKAKSELIGRYEQVDEYAKQNPEWWNHVLSSFDTRDDLGTSVMTSQEAQPQTHEITNDPQVQAVIESLKNEVQGLKAFKQEFDQKQYSDRAKQEDDEYKQEFSQLSEEYPDIEFATPDEEGFTLEYKVLKHANENNIPSFRAAFRDFYFDELMKRGEMKAKEITARDLQQMKRLGLSKSSEPRKIGLSEAQNVRNRSYEDIEREIMDELNSGAY